MQPDNSRNTIIFAVCAAVILLAYQFLVLAPQAAKRKAEAAARPAAASTVPGAAAIPGAGPAIPTFASEAQALAASPRVQVETPMLRGSISLRGGRIDHLYLTQYPETLDPRSPMVELLRPEGLPNAYFAQFGWAGQNVPNLPRESSLWTLAEGDVLKPGKPVVLTYDSGQGLRFRRTISVDALYMFTVSDTVANLGGQTVTLLPYSSVQRRGMPADANQNMVVHEGAVGVIDGSPKLITYKDWTKRKEDFDKATRGGWLGITDKYWMAALIPGPSEAGHGKFRVTTLNGVKVLEAVFESRLVAIPAGRQITHDSKLFAGAKRNEILVGYQDTLQIDKFDLAIDWGERFWIFTRPLFAVLEFFNSHVGNFGLAILLLTVCAKLVFYPLANQAFASMAKIKNLQPKQEELKKKYGDDQTKLQQEMMALYQKEKINPLAGCLPILIQIPIFFSLYKVLFVTIEMRHAPFYGWIRDLSVPDPTTMWNLFGLLPYDPGALPLVGGLLVGKGFLHIGIWPLLYGITMWLQTSMSPTSPDPTQQMIMKWFPVIFTVMLAQSPAGLVIYWAWSNLLTIAQQYIIMRRHKTENPIDGMIARLQGKEYSVSG